MTRLRLCFAAVLAAALAVPVLPAGAVSGDPVPTPGPGVCGGRVIMLQENEVLEERTLHFRGERAVGQVDGYQDQLQGGDRLRMTAEAPTETQDKYMAVRATGVLGNPNFNRNPYQGYWMATLDGAERVVCAGATVFAGTTNGTLGFQLWIDQAAGTAAVRTSTVNATAAANAVSEYKASFPALDVVARDNIVFQLDAATPGGLAFYDSTGRPSHFSYVVVVQAS